MSGLLGLVLLWAAAGILLGIRWRHADADPGTVAVGERGPLRFGTSAEDGSAARAQAMRFAYGAGVACCLVGAVSGVDVVLAFGASLLNLGTVSRLLVVALDRSRVDVPLIELQPRPAASGRFLAGTLLDRPAT